MYFLYTQSTNDAHIMKISPILKEELKNGSLNM